MSAQADNAFRAAIHALREIVAPAVDPANPLATEQLQMVLTWLEFQRGRLPHMHDRRRAELTACIDMATSVAAAGGGSEALQAELDAAARALADPASGDPELGAAAERLETAVAAIVREASGDAASDIERAATRGIKGLLDIRRAWFAPLGVKAGAADLPPLHEVLGVPPDAERGL